MNNDTKETLATGFLLGLGFFAAGKAFGVAGLLLQVAVVLLLKVAAFFC